MSNLIPNSDPGSLQHLIQRANLDMAICSKRDEDLRTELRRQMVDETALNQRLTIALDKGTADRRQLLLEYRQLLYERARLFSALAENESQFATTCRKTANGIGKVKFP